MWNIRERLHAKANTIVRYGMVYFLSGRLPLYVVNEYPRSGGHWVSSMLEKALQVPFPSNRIPPFRPSIMHGHYLHPRGLKNVVVVWRDGRDVMTSLYHHLLFNLPENKRVGFWAHTFRRDLPFSDYDNTAENLPVFLEYFFTRPRGPHFTWADFARRWHNRPETVHVRYEDLRRDAVGELQQVVFGLTAKPLDAQRAMAIVNEFSFERLSQGRQPGQEEKGSFFRKGVVGDWRNHFSREAGQVFDHFAGQELILLGYEQDRSWVETINTHATEIGNNSAV